MAANINRYILIAASGFRVSLTIESAINFMLGGTLTWTAVGVCFFSDSGGFSLVPDAATSDHGVQLDDEQSAYFADTMRRQIGDGGPVRFIG